MILINRRSGRTKDRKKELFPDFIQVIMPRSFNTPVTQVEESVLDSIKPQMAAQSAEISRVFRVLKDLQRAQGYQPMREGSTTSRYMQV